MKMSGNTILITGGASGIGLAFAERLLQEGNTIIVCGRRESRLQEVQAQYPQMHTRVVDVASEEDRIRLVNEIVTDFPELNVLMNNAGIQRNYSLTEGTESWVDQRGEIATNLDAPIHLATLLLPHLQKQPSAAIINVTSGLAFSPKASAPVYCATKAALHSFTLSLRHQLKNTSIEVIEIVPPGVNTDLGGSGLHTWGVPVDEFADGIMARLRTGEHEIGYGTSERNRTASRAELDTVFEQMNNR
ncbi:SDR family oxidoreductase [Paenibacillus sp. Z6-24]